MRRHRDCLESGPLAWSSAVLVLATPLLLYGYLRRHPALDLTFGSPGTHFVIVSVVAGIALTLAVMVALAARHLPDARTFFLAMGFLSMAGVFLAHGVGTAPFLAATTHDASAATVQNDQPRQRAPRTPHEDGGGYGYGGDGYGAYEGSISDTATPLAPAPAVVLSATAVARSQAVGFSARLSLMLSALCFALATLDLDGRLAERIVRRWNLLAAFCACALTAYVLIALWMPAVLSPLAARNVAVSWGVALVAWAALSFAGWRFLQAYRLAALPLQGTMALAMGLLVEAQWFMLRAPLWRLSWWEYHAVMLAAFGAATGGLLWQYRRAGDLGAVVEGLFLRTAVGGLQAGDPRALAVITAAVAAKDSETGAHTERVGDLAVAMGRRLGLPADRLDALRIAGRLHDLGKIGVPNSILRKPGPLTPSEFAVMRRHTTRGWHVARRAGALADVAPIIRAHHERLDGSGYPDGLAGDAIPIAARIIAVADVWDALTCDRPYRAALPHAQAAAIVRREAGAQLDQRCVEALFAEIAARGSTTPAIAA